MTFITGGQRAQTSHGIIVSEIQILDKKVYILIISVMEQTKAKKHMKPLSFMAYDKKPKLCAIRQLTKYLKKNPQDFRKTDNLFWTCIKPHETVSQDTVSMCCKSLLKDGAVNVDNYTYHSLERSIVMCKITCCIYMYDDTECRFGI